MQNCTIKRALDYLRQLPLRAIDRAFADYIANLQDAGEFDVLVAAALSEALGNKHSCLREADLPNWLLDFFSFDSGSSINEICNLATASKIIGTQTEFKPLLKVENRFYLQKYWYFEQQIASSLLKKSELNFGISHNDIKQLLTQLFPQKQNVIDWQKISVANALLHKFAIITGGPGTGKTTTVTKLMAALALANKDTPIVKIVAPTGKAAARLSDSIKQNKQSLNLQAEILTAIPEQAQTIHRLLGSLPNGKFKHDKQNPLHLDVLVVDEASMIDLGLMFQLLEALPEHAALILLGDKDQLASVETGTLLGDLCAGVQYSTSGIQLGWSDSHTALISSLCNEDIPVQSYSQTQTADISSVITQYSKQQNTKPQNTKPLNNKQQNIPESLHNRVTLLQHSYRFAKDSGIGKLANAVNQSEWSTVKESFLDDQVTFIEADKIGLERFVDYAANNYSNYLTELKSDGAYENVISIFKRFSLLCAVKSGDLSVEQFNQLIEQQLQKLGLINSRERFYSGRPVMVVENDYSLNVFNGDIGICLPDSMNKMKVWFSDEQHGLRSLLPNRLPKHETVFAMTIHKSQGSEFESVACALPNNLTIVSKLSRELVYTAITRAKQQFTLLATEPALQKIIQQRVDRSSGLYEQISQQSC